MCVSFVATMCILFRCIVVHVQTNLTRYTYSRTLKDLYNNDVYLPTEDVSVVVDECLEMVADCVLVEVVG